MVTLLSLLETHAPPAPASISERTNILQDVRAGVETVVRAPILWIGILLFALTNVTLAGPYSIALPFLVKQHLNADVDTLGLLYAIFPIGYLLARQVGLLASLWMSSTTTWADVLQTVQEAT